MRIAAMERRNAAVHEAGHVTMAGYVGIGPVYAWLEETPEPGIDEKLWIGHTQYPSSLISRKRISKRKLAMFAVAGAVAEFCWKRETFDEMDWVDPAVMSHSDWATCDCEPGDPSSKLLNIIESVFSLFDREAGELWPAVAIEARSLIKNSRDPPGIGHN